MTLTLGKKVIYPSHGPCLVGPIVERLMADGPTSFYLLTPLDGAGSKLYLPVTRAEAVGIRALLKQAEIPRLLARLRQRGHVNKDWKQRAVDHLKLLASGSAFDLAEIVSSLTTRSALRQLSFSERRVLEKAKKLLVCEISEVIGEAREVAEQRVEKALIARKKGEALPFQRRRVDL